MLRPARVQRENLQSSKAKPDASKTRDQVEDLTKPYALICIHAVGGHSAAKITTRRDYYKNASAPNGAV